MEKIAAPRGTKDVLPAETGRWQYVEGVLRETAHKFGFEEIRFPTFEDVNLFCRGVGETTDVVQKEMYDFTDKGGRHIALRPEGTASVVRAFIEHSLDTQTLPLKVFYIAPNFRYEKPQAGRLREHHQFGVECFGSFDPASDAEVISLAKTVLDTLGIRDIALAVNSCGCPACRPAYHDALKAYFSARKDALCETCRDRLGRNPMRILDCKSPICKELAAGAPVITDYLCDDCRAHFTKLQEHLDACGIAYTVDPHIVRGLDYYTNTVFEFISSSIGAQSTVCGGGRYNGLVESLGGPSMPGLGFGCGLERLLLTMEAQGVAFPAPRHPDLFLAAASPAADGFVQKLVYDLRRSGVSALRDVTGRSLKAQMKYANKLAATYTLVVGEDELANGSGQLKDMATGETAPCALSAEEIAARVSGRAREEL